MEKKEQIPIVFNNRDFCVPIDWSYTEVKKELKKNIAKYSNIVVSKDDIASAKTARAKLNKIHKILDDERKHKKELCLQYYYKFENEIKELQGIVKEPIDAIDKEVKSIESKFKEDKEKEIKKVYNELLVEFKDKVPFSKIFNPKWLNLTYSMGDIRVEIANISLSISNSVDAIKSLSYPLEEMLIEHYFECLDLPLTLKHKSWLDSLLPAVSKLNKQPISDTGKKYTTEFEVTGTKKQLKALKEFMNNNNIKYKGK